MHFFPVFNLYLKTENVEKLGSQKNETESWKHRFYLSRNIAFNLQFEARSFKGVKYGPIKF